MPKKSGECLMTVPEVGARETKAKARTRWRRPQEDIDAIVRIVAAHGDPFAVLGLHEHGDGWVARCFMPGAER
jgi:hypothetical protein